LQGNIAELDNNVYQYMKLKIRVKRFTRTMEAIVDYVRREYSKEMRLFGEEPEGKRSQRANSNAG
jgi:hypothetical protein